MSFWTLEYDGVEQSFQEWGFTDPRMSPRKLAVTTFRVRISGATNLVADPPIPHMGQVIIRRGRTTHLGGFTGGEIVFQGRQITDQRLATRNPADVLTFGDAWWDLENLVFQQQWKCWGAGPGGIYEALGQPFCQLNLFQDFNTAYNITNGAQLEEIISWAAGCGVQIQAGTIDLAWYIQPYPASALSCASAIQICLKPSPGACCFIDMSTTPPTFNARERYYHTALSLPYASGSHRSSELAPRYDMQVPQVVIQYRQGVRVSSGGSSASWTQLYYDAWPLDATLDAGVRGGKQVGAMVVPIQLADFQRTDLVQKVTAAEFGSPPSLDWWKAKKRAMADYTDLAYVGGSLKILDASGADITGAVLASYPNELLDGAVTGWMKDGAGDAIGVQAVTVQGAFTYKEKDLQGRSWHVVGPANPHVVSVNTRLTNSAVGTQSYSITQSLDTGQSPVANLAQYIWTLLSWLFWDGTHSIVERNAAGAPEVGTIIDGRYALNLTGGAAAWAGMLSPVHGAEIDFTHGTTDIQFGLPKHVGPADLEQLCQFYKFRRILNNAGLRSTGNTALDSGEVGGQTARENTSDSKAPPALHVTAAAVEGGGGSAQVVSHDAQAGEIGLKIVDSGNAPVAGFPEVSLKLMDLQYAGS
jgi:hypothetical protein